MSNGRSVGGRIQRWEVEIPRWVPGRTAERKAHGGETDLAAARIIAVLREEPSVGMSVDPGSR
jgi:hypothetical protein